MAELERIPLFKVLMSPEAKNAAARILDSGYVGEGETVEEFEHALAKRLGVPYVLSVNSATSGLHLAMRLAGVKLGDGVVSTAMTCLATNTPILAVGAHPLWADIDHRSGNIDAESIEQLIKNQPCLPSAIMVVHWGGYPCNMRAISRIADALGIPVIEDAAHAFGATYEDEPIGTHSRFVCFSFQAIKHLTCVDGGALVCKNKEDYERGRLLRWFGLDRKKKDRWSEDVTECGYKFHMNNLNAAIGLANLKIVDDSIAKSRENARSYDAHFHGLRNVQTLSYRDSRSSTNWLYTVLVEEPDKFIEHMGEYKVDCSQVHARNDNKSVFARWRRHLPGVDCFSARQVNIPCGFWVGEQERERIINAVCEYKG